MMQGTGKHQGAQVHIAVWSCRTSACHCRAQFHHQATVPRFAGQTLQTLRKQLIHFKHCCSSCFSKVVCNAPHLQRCRSGPQQGALSWPSDHPSCTLSVPARPRAFVRLQQTARQCVTKCRARFQLARLAGCSLVRSKDVGIQPSATVPEMSGALRLHLTACGRASTAFMVWQHYAIAGRVAVGQLAFNHEVAKHAQRAALSSQGSRAQTKDMS